MPRFIIIAAMFALGTLASAQGYQIRVAESANLRAGPGLDYRRLATTPSGTILRVSGQNGRLAMRLHQCRGASSIVFDGSPGFRRQLADSLNVLRSKAPEWYIYATNGLDRALQIFPKDPSCIAGVDPAKRTWHLDYGDANTSHNPCHVHIAVTAALFIHEACHVYQDEAGRRLTALESERECVEMELHAQNVFDPHSDYTRWNRGILKNIHRREWQWWH